jgi:transcriptional regulator with XRE-family HTH domain
MTPPRDHLLKTFGQWVARMRRAKGISQERAAEIAGLSRTQWTRIELGTSGTRAENLPGIARAIDADPAETYRHAGLLPPGSAGVPPAPPTETRETLEIHEDALEEYNRWWFRFEGEAGWQKLTPAERDRLVHAAMEESRRPRPHHPGDFHRAVEDAREGEG